MDGRTIRLGARWSVTALALIVVLALVLGLRPRILAEQVGVAPTDGAACFLCDGSATAATIAPVGRILPTVIPPLTLLGAAMLLLPALTLAAPGLGSAPPPPPPPRS
jgi:hypothetical protein